MSIRTVCSHCGKVFQVKEEYVGRGAKCAGCGQAFVIQPLPEQTRRDTQSARPAAKDIARQPGPPQVAVPPAPAPTAAAPQRRPESDVLTLDEIAAAAQVEAATTVTYDVAAEDIPAPASAPARPPAAPPQPHRVPRPIRSAPRPAATSDSFGVHGAALLGMLLVVIIVLGREWMRAAPGGGAADHAQQAGRYFGAVLFCVGFPYLLALGGFLVCGRSRRAATIVFSATLALILFSQLSPGTGGAPCSAPSVVSSAARTSSQTLAAGIELQRFQLSGSGAGLPMQLHLYLPAGRHSPKSLPCVLIAPAGSANHGMAIGEGDQAEHTPYVRAGFAAVCYELSGGLPGEPRAQYTYAEIAKPLRQFMEAEGGLANARLAIDYLLKNAPEIDPDQLFAAGHSSAAVVALNLAAADRRIRACAAYAPCTDVEEWWADPRMERVVSGYQAFARRHSPLRKASAMNCPVYLFHADVDSVVSLADNQRFADALRSAGKQITFDRVPVGGHYDSMILLGIPRGINFMKAHGARPAAGPSAR